MNSSKAVKGKNSETTDLDLGFDIIDGITALHLERDRLPSQGFDKDLHRFSSRVLSIKAREKKIDKDNKRTKQVSTKLGKIRLLFWLKLFFYLFIYLFI